ncbi:nitroreductase family deazaflavin-dependent oxidoreductase [Planctomonas sp. JC2975]|uniref:nitroreductase family deazaflavin-dependent oxidoreductase n=1 Tax=Planctomonas sp. JC2975 TaxID=2729626 RepID=UPI0014758667|nr:nitroreductase family deazaflavin-dependent oxidoreductase [Planctomonas sp. JC2975]NNC11506.1 nitroreductase family deazaflavin-dependent oxidoreductase [Planctomonas sp. JC2975]
MPLTGEWEPGTSGWAREQVEEFEASDGRKANTLRGVPIVVVTMVGAKSGKLRKNPVMRVEHDGEYAVVASKGGAEQHPTWFHNIVKNPNVELQDGAKRRDYVAHLAEGAERDAWWERAVAVWPDYAGYQKKTERIIPVFVLVPVEV